MATYIQVVGATGLLENGDGGFFHAAARPLLIHVREDGWSLRCMDPMLWADFSYALAPRLRAPWTKPRTEAAKLLEGKIKLWDTDTPALKFQDAQEVSMGGFGDTMHGEVPGFELRRNAAVALTPYPRTLPTLLLQLLLLNE